MQSSHCEFGRSILSSQNIYQDRQIVELGKHNCLCVGHALIHGCQLLSVADTSPAPFGHNDTKLTCIQIRRRLCDRYS